MKLKFLFFLCLVIWLSSCKKQQETHLPPEKIQQLLFDIHLAESYSAVLNEDSTHRRQERNIDSLVVFYRSIFKHHQISQTDFEQSLDWYKHHPEELDSIYADMIPEMSKLEGTFD